MSGKSSFNNALPNSRFRQSGFSFDRKARRFATPGTGQGYCRIVPKCPGDIGWITHRHGVLYAEEYGWDEKFEALVAGIAAKFIENLDPERERCWMAEQNGDIVGSVTLVKKSKNSTSNPVPGVWARAALAARRIYEREGFRRIATGQDFETWELNL